MSIGVLNGEQNPWPRVQSTGISTSLNVRGAAAATAAAIPASRGLISLHRAFPTTTMAILRLVRSCSYRRFWSVVTNPSNPAASAASSRLPFRRVSSREPGLPRLRHPSGPRPHLVECRCRTVPASTCGNRHVEASGGKLKDGFDLLPGHRELLHHFVYGHAVFEVLEDNGHRCPGVLEHPGPADLAGNALHGRALRPNQALPWTDLLRSSLREGDAVVTQGSPPTQIVAPTITETTGRRLPVSSAATQAQS